MEDDMWKQRETRSLSKIKGSKASSDQSISIAQKSTNLLIFKSSFKLK
jgi:hypothetical protein